jgi:hypothetical protein
VGGGGQCESEQGDGREQVLAWHRTMLARPQDVRNGVCNDDDPAHLCAGPSRNSPLSSGDLVRGDPYLMNRISE